jgi:hypothetical protein
MKPLIFAITLLTLTTLGRTQEVLKTKDDKACFYKKKYSHTDRMKFYPFNSYPNVKLVSFRYHKNDYPIKPGIVMSDSILESIQLDDTEVAKLTDILYNNFYKRKPNYGTIAQCYYPRNAILFVDTLGKLQEYVIICFHCSRYQKSSDQVKLGDDCDEKPERLRQLFISLGLRFGTDLAIDNYPGEAID